jgi:CelD/BcsL family acetyltransferase involved in cellulose biosynthesis
VDITEMEMAPGVKETRRRAPNLSIAIHTEMEPLETEWRALEAASHNSPHQAYDYCRAWRDSFGRPLRIVVGRMDERLAFVLPLEITRGRLFTRAQFIGAEHSNINTGLFSAEFLARASRDTMDAIAAEMREALVGVDCIVLTNMPGIWRDMVMPFTLLPHIANQNHAFQLRMKATFVDTLAQLNAKRRRKKYSVGHRRLEALGGYEHVVAETTDEKHALLDMFFEQKAARLAEFGLPNVFACPKTRAFLHATLDAPQDGTNFPLRMHALRMTGGEFAGETPAIAGLTRKGDHVIVQFCSIGSGPTTDGSPGELLFHLMVEQYNQHGAGLFDFGIGDMPFKRSWCTDETVQINVSIPVTPVGRLAALKEETATRLKTLIKQNPALYQLLQRIRSRSHTTPVAED